MIHQWYLCLDSLISWCKKHSPGKLDILSGLSSFLSYIHHRMYCFFTKTHALLQHHMERRTHCYGVTVLCQRWRASMCCINSQPFHTSVLLHYKSIMSHCYGVEMPCQRWRVSMCCINFKPFDTNVLLQNFFCPCYFVHYAHCYVVTVPCQRWRANMRLFYEFWIIWHIYVDCYIINIFWDIWYICPSCINVSRVVDCCWHVDCTYCFGVMVPDDQYVLSIHPCLPSFIHTNQLWLISCLWKMNGQGFEQMLSWNNRNDIALFVNPNWQKLWNK